MALQYTDRNQIYGELMLLLLGVESVHGLEQGGVRLEEVGPRQHYGRTKLNKNYALYLRFCNPNNPDF